MSGSSLRERIDEWNAAAWTNTGSLEVHSGDITVRITTPAPAGIHQRHACPVCGEAVGIHSAWIEAERRREWGDRRFGGGGKAVALHLRCADPIEAGLQLGESLGLTPGNGVTFPGGYRRAPIPRPSRRRDPARAARTAHPERLRFATDPIDPLAAAQMGGTRWGMWKPDRETKAHQRARARLVEGLRARGVDIPDRTTAEGGDR
ncbi:MAG: hypothetical protein D6683_09510 [Actinomyces sp.]|nr:MAG: hypothetical protein D6683_09510 [Actinomyces sp.]